MIKISKQGALDGYKTKDLAKIRRSILDKYLKLYGYASVVKRLNAISILNKNRNPTVSEIMKKDIRFIQRHYSHLRKSPKPSRKSTKRKSRKSTKRKSRKSKRKSRKSTKRKSRKSKRKSRK